MVCDAATERNKGESADPQQAELAASQQRLQDYAIGQMLKGNVSNFERIADYYRVFHLEFPAQAFMLLVVKLRGYPGAGEPDAQENAYGTVKEELTGILGMSRTLYFAEKDGVLVCFYCQPGVSIQPPSDNQEPLREIIPAVSGLRCNADGKHGSSGPAHQSSAVFFRAGNLYGKAGGSNSTASAGFDRHYRDPEISVSSLAEQFRLNTSYLPWQFKQEYGCGVLEYIHKCRVSEAKLLIAQGTELDEVAIQTGYPSRCALDSAFSRYEGITPQAYQRQRPTEGKELLR